MNCMKRLLITLSLVLSAIAVKASPTDVICGPWISDVTPTSFTVNWVTEGETLSWEVLSNNERFVVSSDGKTITVKAYDTAGKLTNTYILL